MSSFEDRKKSFEKKFAHDEERQFKINAKKNKYIQDVIKADFAEAGDEDVFRKIKIDLKEKDLKDEEIRDKMKELNEKAKSDFM